MATNRTFTMIKPDAVANGHAGKILDMTSGPIYAAILEKDNAIEDFRKLIGATDPQKADAGTIRNLFAKSIDANAIHGSDSDENAEIEGNFFFGADERF